jgi:membrane protein insertase Oxa1/YidC/SpoIIIJ
MAMPRRAMPHFVTGPCFAAPSCAVLMTAPLTARRTFVGSALGYLLKSNAPPQSAGAAAAAADGTSVDAATAATLKALEMGAGVDAGASAAAAAARAPFLRVADKSTAELAAAAAQGDVSMPPMFALFDGVYSTIANTLGAIVPDVSPLINVGISGLQGFQAALDLTWPGAFFAFGVCIRLATLGFTLYSERASLRMQLALPELRDAYQRFEIVYYDPRSTTAEVNAVSTALKAKQAEVYAKHGTSNRNVLATLCSTPIFAWGFWVAMRATSTLDDVAATSWRWVPTLADVDPTYILPCCAVAATVLNFELLFWKKGGANGTGVSNYLPWAVRIGAASCITVISQFRSAVLMYWIGVSLTGMLQPLLMRSRTFMKLYGVPLPEQLTEAFDAARRAAEEVHGKIHDTASAPESADKTRTAFMDKLRMQSPLLRAPKTGVVDALREKDAQEARLAAATDPLQQRLMMSMPMMAQGVVDPERSQKLADDITEYNSKQLEDAQRRRSWKAHRKE